MRLIIFLMFVVLVGCAQIKSLDGGAKDTEAPKIVYSTLNNETLSFKEKQVTFIFDEYIVLNDAQGQLIFSPQLKSFPDIQVKGKQLTIGWKDTLLSNTTYQFDFGNAIVDNTEGNVVAVSRVFSTGTTIDSLQIAGRVSDAWSLEKTEGAVVQLVSDLPKMGQTYQPMYQVKTNKEGFFLFKYLSPTPYFVISFTDSNGNARWDDKEPLDWTKERITPMEKPDTTVFCQAKTLIPNNGFLDFQVDSCGWMGTFWDHRWSPAQIQCRDSILYNVSYQDDSLFVVLNPAEREGYFTFLIADSSFQDSLTIPCFKEAFLNGDFTIPKGQKVLSKDSLRLKLPISATGWDQKKWSWVLKDTSVDVHGNWFKEQHELRVSVPYSGFSGEAVIQVRKGGIFSNDWLMIDDTIQKTIEWLKEDQSGFFQVVSVPNDWQQHQFVLEGAKEQWPINPENLSKGIALIPGKYRLKVWEDKNKNGHWDNNDYLLNEKAEKVIYRSPELNIRANWQEVLDLGK